MNAAAASTLVGLTFELAGAFLLAAEAIGLDRIRAWKEQWLDRPTYILSPRQTLEIARRAKERWLRWLPSLAIGVACGTGAGIGTWLAQSAEVLGGSRWFAVPCILGGGLVGMVVPDAAVFVLRSASRLLDQVQLSAGKGTIGLLGFVMLALGLILQALGVLPSVFLG
jgi:hypothetical protein